jgi:hypothetical protein
MKRSRFTEERIVHAITQVDAGVPVQELCAFSAPHLVPREVETLLGTLLPRPPIRPEVQAWHDSAPRDRGER